MFFCLVLAGTLIVLPVAFVFGPAITVLWNSDAIGNIFQSYSITFTQPGKLIMSILRGLCRGVLAGILIFMLSYGLIRLFILILSIEGLMGIQAQIALDSACAAVFPADNSLIYTASGLSSILTIVLRLAVFFSAGIGWSVFVTEQLTGFARMKFHSNQMDLL